jgi:hypothetical protein
VTLPGRSLDWLRRIDRKAAAPDDWTRGAESPPSWPEGLGDDCSGSQRCDALSDAALPLALMAHHTPAWTERYVAITDRLLERHVAWWSAADWMSAADAAGERRDPVTADAMAPYTASLLVLLGVRSLLTADTRWDRPFEVIGDGRDSFTWSHGRIVEDVVGRWPALAANPAVEPETLVTLGLGLRLYDVRFGTDHHRTFRSWWGEGSAALRDGSRPPSVTITAALHLAPQVPDDARALFEGALAAAREQGVDLDDRARGAAILLSREWGLTGPEAQADPPNDACSLLAAADVGGPDRLTTLGLAVVEGGPVVVDVEAPALVLSRAEWSNGSLILELDVERDDPSVWATFRIVGAEPRLWYLTGIDRATMDVTSSAVIVRVPLVSGPLEFTPGSY